MRVVLDTNVFLSALISPHGTSAIIYSAWMAGQFEVITSTVQLDELRQASRYPKLKAVLQPARVGTMINNLQHATLVEPLVITNEAIDPDDEYLISMSMTGKADYLVTGDHRAGILQKIKIGHTCVVTPRLFCEEVIR